MSENFVSVLLMFLLTAATIYSVVTTIVATKLDRRIAKLEGVGALQRETIQGLQAQISMYKLALGDQPDPNEVPITAGSSHGLQSGIPAHGFTTSKWAVHVIDQFNQCTAINPKVSP